MHHGGELNGVDGELPAVERNVAREAARWLLRLSSGRATDADVQACDQWRASKAEHEHAWQRAQRVNERFGLIPSALGMATLNRPELSSRRAALKTLVALMVAGPVGWAAWRADPMNWTADYRSGAGERRNVVLADGSTLQLNTASAVDVAFDASTRLLRLRAGEIAVHVVADSVANPVGNSVANPVADSVADSVAAPFAQPRPFVVRTRLGDIEAPPSRFCVREDGVQCQVSVQEGRVRLSRRGRVVSLAAGQQGSLSEAGVSDPSPADPHAGDWMRGVLHASQLRLDAFAVELGRYRPGVLRCDPEVAHLRISGAFQLNDTDAVLAALPATLPVQVRYRTPYWVTIGPRASSA
ncbi:MULTISPECIES: FecR domain-containing protein [Achromobacter]|uniref:FecR domain-containing protein n=1 Tax=Achromobacter spanius TaxID=217203 RepID=A0ABY8H112_9BURK|nr:MULTISPECIES: FecR domain-containing protein [Achromobacter]WAI85340.1 FecR domain-containing protein [Achromobacter spanius]WEX95423.1 FecR domain-containing protein [Achromobacter sp. SS2-2022]WFP10857.1 FecR domain-containing protein [Achromobacter spanius]